MMPQGPLIRKHDRTKEKKCIQCKKWRLIEMYFGIHETASDGRQSICKTCKGSNNAKSQKKNVVARVRHHIASRCLVQLGELAPKGFTKGMEAYLGYTVSELVRHLRNKLRQREGVHRRLRDALNEGYHIDHIRPLSLFKVIVAPTSEQGGEGAVDWDVFKECWAIENLEAIPGEENLKKGAKFEEAKEEEEEEEQEAEVEEQGDGSLRQLSIGATDEVRFP